MPGGFGWQRPCAYFAGATGPAVCPSQHRAVVIEFDRVGQARVAPDSSAYAEALAGLAGGAKRDNRFVEGV
jgi:hypothetical protein